MTIQTPSTQLLTSNTSMTEQEQTPIYTTQPLTPNNSAIEQSSSPLNTLPTIATAITPLSVVAILGMVMVMLAYLYRSYEGKASMKFWHGNTGFEIQINYDDDKTP